jgi:hypothetical protein
MGGSLNVTCGTTGSWSQFPNCVSSTGSGSITTTAVSVGTGSPCVVDKTTTYNITNGYPTAISLSYISDTTATGNSVKFTISDILFDLSKDQFNLHAHLVMLLIQVLVHLMFVTIVNGLLNHDV